MSDKDLTDNNPTEGSALRPRRHIIPYDKDGPLVEPEEFLEELESYEEQFENEHFDALQAGKYISGYDPAESTLVEILARYTSLSMVQLDDATRFAITQLSIRFEQILTDGLLQQDMRKLLGYLQIPMLKLAIKDSTFITDISNPAILMFYKLSDIAETWAPQNNVLTDQLYKKLAGIVQDVREQNPLTYKYCNEILEQLIAEGVTLHASMAEDEVDSEEQEVVEAPQVEDEPEEVDELMELVETLNVGVRLHYNNGEEVQLLRIAAILPTGGEIVLVNRDHEKVGAFDKQDIYEGLMDGSMELVADTLEYDRALETVISSQRKR